MNKEGKIMQGSLEIFFICVLAVGAGASYMASRHFQKRLQKVEQANREMISNIAHELKTPMTSIIGFVETLQNGAIENPEKARNFLDIIAIETSRLHSIIDETLEISRLDNLKEDNNKTEFVIDEAVEEVVQSLEPIAAQDNITLNVYYTDSKPIKVFANKVRIQQVVTNIVGNAIKYNYKDGKVDITVSGAGKVLKIKVFNTGRGIKNEHFAQLFDRFYRVDDGRARDVGGTGLGLSIVKKILQLYGGRIEVESSPEVSATFTVTLPIVVI